MVTATPRIEHRDEPLLPSGRITLQPPPRVDRDDGTSGGLAGAVPMIGSLGTIAVLTTTGSATPVQSYVAAGSFLVATIALVAVQLDRQRRQRIRQATGARAEYLRHLGAVRRAAREAADQQRRALVWRHPVPDALPSLADEGSRTWELAGDDERFLQVRYGTGPRPLAVELVPPDDVPDVADPAAAAALHRLLTVQRIQPGLPVHADLRAHRRIELTGPGPQTRALARALVCSATVFHGPDHLVLGVLASGPNLRHWDWVKWLPHAQSTRGSDDLGPWRMVATSPAGLRTLLPAGLHDPEGRADDDRAASSHVLLVNDGADVPPDLGDDVTVLDLTGGGRDGEPDDTSVLRLQIGTTTGQDREPPVVASPGRGEPVRALADQCDPATAEAFARRLAPLHTVPRPTQTTSGGITAPSDFMDLLGLGDVHAFEPSAAWRPCPARDRLRVPIGLGEGGAPVHLDIKEPAQQGMGPHGLVIGATGSGKSEFLRTLVLGLAMTHSPGQLNLVLVDFKGGATFAGMAEMPHVSAVITNLAQELTLVDRMQDALSGEMVRRQELLRGAGNFASVRDYERARVAGEDLAPLPSLFIVVDEFSEMLSARPEFIDLFVAIGRLGRSLGLHLLLASQRLEEGRLRGLESHLSYRVGLRTFSAGESRSVLGVPDAHELPPVPGLGYLKPDQSTLLRFKAAYVSGPPSGRGRGRRDAGGPPQGIRPFTISQVQTLHPAEHEPEPATPPPVGDAHPVEQDSLLELAVARMDGHGPAAHQVWLPPLDLPDTLDSLMDDLAEHPDLGLVSERWRSLDGLRVPLGTVDRPREQRRDTLTVDLSGATGHLAVVGGPRSGKSTVLRTVVTSLALTTTPLESQFFVLDFGGGTFTPLASLPHVSGIGTRFEPDVVRRILAEVHGAVDRREAYFRTHGIDTIETYRSRRAAGRADDGYGDVLLVIDGWATLRADFDDLETELVQLASRGLAYGLHVIAGAARWADFRPAMRDVLGTRLELRLGDALDSEIDRRLATLVPTGRPGRGLTQTRLHCLAALPRIDGTADAATLGDGVDDLVARVRAAWRGPAGPRLRLLPERIDLDAVRARASQAADRGGRLLLGIDEKELAPVGLDPGSEPHLLVFGDGRSGKSTVLRSYVREVMRTRTPQEAQIVVVDYRRSLLGEVPEEYLLHYLTSSGQAQTVLHELGSYLENRLPGPDVTPEQLRHRSWWTGAEVFVVVDDHDLVATRQSSPVEALQPLLAQARDVGLHLAVTRRSGGASRALYEPVIQSLRELGMPGLLLSGSPDEGPLIGTLKPVPAPPGRGRLVTRDRGVEVVQMAWTDVTP